MQPRTRPARAWSALALACAGALVLAPSAEAGPESAAQQLHRRGVHCMEEIERSKCAIEHFEALVAEDTNERALVTDAILRLTKLYRKAGEDEALRAVLRRFWEAGGKRQRQGHLPYSSRHLPADLDMIGHVDLLRSLAAPLARRIPAEVPELLVSCDEARRKALEAALDQRKAERRARAEGITVDAALAKIRAEEEAEERRRAERRKAREAQSQGKAKKTSEPVTPTPSEAPIFVDSTCEVARALGMDGAATWVRIAVAASHRDARRSAEIAQIPGLADRLQAAVAAGKVQAIDARRYRMVGHEYAGAPVEIASFDLDELTIAPPAVMAEIAAAVDSGRVTLNREVKKLLGAMPREVAFLGVTTGEAIRELGLRDGQGGRRRLLEALLPRPDGLQIAGVAHEYFGVFLRMPTDNPVKAQLLVDVALKFLEASEDDDAETKELMRGLDLARASDRRAILISYVMAPATIEDLILQ